MDETNDIGLGISANSPNQSNPFQESSAETAVSASTIPSSISNHGNEEFTIKPIRLAKRHEKRTSEENNGEFHCRPMRLGSRNKSVSSPSDETPTSTPNSVKRKKSIQIRNLPIVETSFTQDINSHVNDMIFAVCLVDFHHVRGPEIQWWRSNYYPLYPQDSKLFKNLPFQALPDGSHLFEETFSNFNLVYDFKTGKSYDDGEDYNSFEGDPRHLETLFGCSCVRQVKTSDLSDEERSRNKDITRSIVQKAVVVIAKNQPIFQIIKEKLSIISASYFLQNNFSNTQILESLYDNLNSTFKINEKDGLIKDTVSKQKSTLNEFVERQDEFFVNLNLKQTLLKFKTNLLVIFKALLLEKKVLIYSNNNLEMLTQFQNNLISLIPNLINNLGNSGCPLSDFVETNGPLTKPNSLNTSSRQSMLRFFGLPLQIFNTKGSFWNPYLPLQQLSELSASETRSYMVGCSNLLFVNQLESLNVDLLINLDTTELTYPKGKPEELHLSSKDKKFINVLISKIKGNEKDEWQNDKDSEQFIGSDDFVRFEFEDYLLSLLSTTRYNQYSEKFNQPPPGFSNTTSHQTENVEGKLSSDSSTIVDHLDDDVNLNNIENGNLTLFNSKFVECWLTTNNFKIWHQMADEFIFNFLDPKHISVGLINDNEQYKFTALFNNLKLRLNSNQTSSVLNSETKAQKFIPSSEETFNTDINKEKDTREQSTPTDDDVPSTPTKPIGNRISSWTSGWGFKKK
ncbi:uncharacterized protein AC631_03369 [Debaryomyces fabryi]|uniref:UDENN domain-containing protein n=1 Tax=Debaryomyces fabryi TaxID=58627 RepID=A0A0V1PX78_9ASCO|nr:uncharacterized protein AC631_03369 [Debaryomyces fabryi]KSA00884.1 hypothetical protein AC631_03369 [Debaryomyces fabryi]CUM46080.1 unnamed protein product [Debaryomyces fabryi]